MSTNESLSELMVNEPATQRDRFQISLKWLLIVVPLLGATFGIMGRFFYEDPNYFRLGLLVLCWVVPFVLAVGTTIRLGWQLQRRNIVVWGALLACMPLLGLLTSYIAERQYGNSPGGLGILSNADLIDKRLPKQVDEPWVWRELDRRALAGSLSQAEVDDAVRKLITHMKNTQPQGWNRPLTWERDFLKNQAGQISEEVMIELCDAFYSTKPRLRGLPRLLEGKNIVNLSIEFGNQWGVHSGLPIALLWTVEQISVDGQPVDLESDMHHFTSWDGHFLTELSPGEHQITAQIVCCYIDAQRVTSGRTGAVEMFRWPKKRLKEWNQTVSATLQVAEVDAQLIDLSTDPKDDPLARRMLQVLSASMLPGPDDESELIVEFQCSDRLSCPLSFDVVASIDSKDVDLGRFMIATWADHKSQSGMELRKRIAKPAESVKSIKLILKPNPEYVERIPEVNKIWGKEVGFSNVPLKRFDQE